MGNSLTRFFPFLPNLSLLLRNRNISFRRILRRPLNRSQPPVPTVQHALMIELFLIDENDNEGTNQGNANREHLVSTVSATMSNGRLVFRDILPQILESRQASSPPNQTNIVSNSIQSSQSQTSEVQSDADNTPSPNPSNSTQRSFRSIIIYLDDEVASRILNGNTDEEITDLIAQVLSISESKGTPPASQKMIDLLPILKLDTDLIESSGGKCTICCEEYIEGNTVIQLPCLHIFDKECLMPWLKQHCSCPVCRYELPVDDQNYEKERKNRMQSRNIQENSFFQSRDINQDQNETSEATNNSTNNQSSEQIEDQDSNEEMDTEAETEVREDSSEHDHLQSQSQESENEKEEENSKEEEEEKVEEEDTVNSDHLSMGSSSSHSAALRPNRSHTHTRSSHSHSNHTNNREPITNTKFRNRREDNSYFNKLKRWFQTATNRNRQNHNRDNES